MENTAVKLIILALVAGLVVMSASTLLTAFQNALGALGS